MEQNNVSMASERRMMSWISFVAMVAMVMFYGQTARYMVPTFKLMFADFGTKLPTLSLHVLWFSETWMLVTLTVVLAAGLLIQIVCGAMKFTFVFHVIVMLGCAAMLSVTVVAMVLPMRAIMIGIRQ